LENKPVTPTNYLTKACLSAALLLGLVMGELESALALTAAQFNHGLGTGINLGNALDAPREGEWGVTLEANYFRQIHQAGFTHVRLPVRWSSHAGQPAPYKLDPVFTERVRWAVHEALKNNLKVVLNMHHYEEFESDPDAHRERLLAMWQQISEEFKNEPRDQVAFEIYNEPAKKISAVFWNDLFAEALAVVRKKNPKRIVVVGPVQWNSISALDTLKLPSDKNLLVSVHYYEPFHFTHQGAEWVGEESKNWLGTTWSASAEQIAALKSDFDKAQKWAQTHERLIYLGEFGAYSKGDMDSRARWTESVRKAAIDRGFSLAYWEFCSGFGAYDPASRSWRKPLLNALHAHFMLDHAKRPGN